MTDLAATPGWGDHWACGAFQPTPPRRMKPYRCSELHDHLGDHRAVIDGEVVAQWPRSKPHDQP